jgi:hypothetical protein
LWSGEKLRHIAVFSTQGYSAAHLANFIENRFARYRVLGLTTVDTQRICDSEAVNSRVFMEELDRLELRVEAGNLEILQAMIRRFQRNGRLPEHRGEALKTIFKALLKSARLGRRKQLQVFQVLGLRWNSHPATL